MIFSCSFQSFIYIVAPLKEFHEFTNARATFNKESKGLPKLSLVLG